MGIKNHQIGLASLKQVTGTNQITGLKDFVTSLL
jgi:hypothetical protein